VTGQYQCKSKGLVPLLRRVNALKRDFASFDIRHVLRCGSSLHFDTIIAFLSVQSAAQRGCVCFDIRHVLR